MTGRRKQQEPVFRADGFGNEAACAQFLNRSPSCLRAWRAADRGPPFIQVDGRGPVLYYLPEVEAWLWGHKRVPGIDPPREPQQKIENASTRDNAPDCDSSSVAMLATARAG